ncbi:MAG: hypothetical protein GY909_00425 [Oligoflexia bacterium]|nr:hypothetical protein [Oligoflexia bacterium]
MKLIALFAVLFTTSIFANDLDTQLDKLIKEHNLVPLNAVKRDETEVIRLGAMLFHETELSGPRNIACNVCHHPRFGTSDGIPFSIGEGGTGVGTFRNQKTGGVTGRHSPHLINLGYQDIQHMFWDGRVFRDEKTGELQTPEPALNGKNPKLKKVAKTLSMSLSAQVIFPILNELEMKGKNNDIADAKTNVEAWEAVMKRLTKGPKSERYMAQFKKAFPKAQEYHIGHVGESLGIFLKNNFNLVNTPYDKYLRGDKDALTDSQKRGLIVFASKGKCTECHKGRHLSDFDFKSVAAPQINLASQANKDDFGRFDVTKKEEDRYKFRTPPLRNISITAPFMHSGAFATLEQVIEHYNMPRRSLHHFDITKMDFSVYDVNFVYDSDFRRNEKRISAIDVEEMRHRGLGLTQQEKDDLLSFLNKGLLDYRLHD